MVLYLKMNHVTQIRLLSMTEDEKTSKGVRNRLTTLSKIRTRIKVRDSLGEQGCTVVSTVETCPTNTSRAVPDRQTLSHKSLDKLIFSRTVTALTTNNDSNTIVHVTWRRLKKCLRVSSIQLFLSQLKNKNLFIR